MRKKLFKGPIGKALVRGGGVNVGQALNEVADRWISEVAKAKKAYVEGLANWLARYLPQIENEYIRLVNERPDYFNPANRYGREQVAMLIMEKTHEIAEKYKEKKMKDLIQKKAQNVSQFSGYGLSLGSNKEEPKKVEIKSIPL